MSCIVIAQRSGKDGKYHSITVIWKIKIKLTNIIMKKSWGSKSRSFEGCGTKPQNQSHPKKVDLQNHFKIFSGWNFNFSQIVYENVSFIRGVRVKIWELFIYFNFSLYLRWIYFYYLLFCFTHMFSNKLIGILLIYLYRL